MKKKLTIKQEGFCKDFIATGNASEAYRRNYNAGKMLPDSVTNKAYELMQNVGVTSRIQKLQVILQKKFEVTVESLTKELEEDRQLARDLGQPGAAIAAIGVKARIHGLDKQVMSNDPENPMPATIQVEIIKK